MTEYNAKDDAIKSYEEAMKHIHPLLKVELPYPPSVNGMFSSIGRRRVKSKRYKEWIDDATMAVLSQRKGKRITGRIAVSISSVKPDKRKRDVDNIIKPILDLLTSTQTILDDSQVIKVSSEWAASGAPCTVIVRAG